MEPSRIEEDIEAESPMPARQPGAQEQSEAGPDQSVPASQGWAAKSMFVRVSVLIVVIIVIISAAGFIYQQIRESEAEKTTLDGTLTYMANTSYPNNGIARFNISLANPKAAFPQDVHVTVFDADGNISGTVRTTFLYSSNWSGMISTGNYLAAAHNSYANISGYKIVLEVAGYSGSIIGLVPY